MNGVKIRVFCNNPHILCQISSFHSGDTADSNFLGRDAVSLLGWVPKYQRHYDPLKHREPDTLYTASYSRRFNPYIYSSIYSLQLNTVITLHPFSCQAIIFGNKTE
jgi:hypothetical protein